MFGFILQTSNNYHNVKGQKYEPPHYACTSSLIPMQNLQRSHSQKHSPNSEHSHYRHSNYSQQQQQPQTHQHASHQPNHQQYPQHQQHSQSPHRNVPPIPSVRPYMKPLPKLPTHIGKKFNKI